MQILVNFLIVFFMILIIYELFLANTPIKEGFGGSGEHYYSSAPVTHSSSTSTTSTAAPAAAPAAATSQPAEYRTYNTNEPNNALVLAQQNAGNIQVLKGQMDNLMNLNKEVQDIHANVVSLQTQVSTIAQAQQQYTSQMAAKPTPQITGVVPNNTSTTTTS
jgi:hypothetical protein